jgi:hypothetical protein
LTGRQTLNTIPLKAFRNHGHLRASVEEHVGQARGFGDAPERMGLSFRDATDKLLEDGIARWSARTSPREAVSQ